MYLHTTPNNKRYVGITHQYPLNLRWKSGKGYKGNTYFYKAIQKYGWDNIKHEVLFENLTKEEAEQKEIELIEFYKSNNRRFGYNIENGGNCCGTHSEETKKKISIANKGNTYCLGRKISKEHIEKLRIGRNKIIGGFYGKRHTLETKQKMSEAQKGKIVSIKTRKLISQKSKERLSIAQNNPMYGKKHSKETVEKIRAKAIGRTTSKKTKKLLSEKSSKKVAQYDKKMSLIKTFDSIKKAGEELSIFPQNIGFCCKNKHRTAKGFYWRYVEK